MSEMYWEKREHAKTQEKLDEQIEKVAAQQEIINHQREALQLLLNAIWIHINSGGSDEQLQEAFRVVTSTSTMTGTSEE